VQTARGRFAAPREFLTPAFGRPDPRIGGRQADLIDAQDAPSGLFDTAEARALKTETAIDALRARFGASAVVAGRALKN
ncbi:MAG: DNA polymerase IV, partial [Brevundimonas sp.]